MHMLLIHPHVVSKEVVNMVEADFPVGVVHIVRPHAVRPSFPTPSPPGCREAGRAPNAALSETASAPGNKQTDAVQKVLTGVAREGVPPLFIRPRPPLMSFQPGERLTACISMAVFLLLL